MPSTPVIVASDSGAEAGLSATLTFSITVPPGFKRALTVEVTQATALVDINSATFNGVAMTAAAQFTTGGIRNMRFFHLLNPDEGTHDFVATFANANSRPQGLWALWKHVESIDDITNADGNGTTMSWTIDSADGNLVGALFKSNAGDAITWAAPAAERLDEAISTIGQASVADEIGATSVTINGTKTNGAWGGTAFNMVAAVGLSGDGALTGVATLVGVGVEGLRYWRVSCNAPQGTNATMIVFTDETMTVVEQVGAVVANATGEYDLLADDQGIAIDSKRFAVVHNWDGDPDTTAIDGGAGIATVSLQ
jgi:hypothetical protein